jgi:eukaryotic-like serine/threonine-protein kinase
MARAQTVLNNRYRIGRRLGEGGMAVVHLGHDLILGRDVAVKTLRPQYAADPAVRARFNREAHAAASLAHPNVIDVYDVGEENGVPFIVMELVDGQSLKAIIAAEAPFHPDDVAALMGQIASALDYAHARGYVHRDVKPGNILLDEHSRVRVVDFGIAKSLADSDLTEAGGGFGTAAYLSPEQAEGLMATPASDVYSLGVVAFELLTGQPPFRADTPVGLAMRHVNDDPPAPSELVPAVPAAVDAVVLRALEKDPTRRWPTAGEFARALRDWRARQAPVALPVDDDAPAPQRTGGALGPTVAVVAIVLIALAALLWLGLRPNLLTENDTPAPTTNVVFEPPEITGGVDPGPAEAVPQIVQAGETDAEQAPAPAEPVVAPTIAPVTEAAVTVPDLRGLTVADANAALLPRGLRLVQGQPVFSETVPLNAIVTQDPPPDTPAAAGRIVRVSLSRGPSPFLEEGQP